MRKRLGRPSLGTLVEVATTLAIIAAAWLFTAHTKSYAFVPLPKMLSTFGHVWFSHEFLVDALPSFKRLAIGYVASVAIGAAGGFLVGLSPTVRLMFYPAINFFRAIPPVALIPAALFVLGIGDSLQIFIIAVVCVWPIFLNVADGVAEIDETYISAARSYGIDGFDRFRYVVVPAVGPRLAVGMRTSLSFAVLLLVSSEMIAATSGIGHFVFEAQQLYKTDTMWAGIILLGLIGVVLNVAFAMVEKRVLHWHFRAGRSA